MPKPEREFFPIADVEWERNKEGSSQQVLAFDPDTGDITKIVTRDPGHEQFGDQQVHDFWRVISPIVIWLEQAADMSREEVLMLDGALYDKGLKKWFKAGDYTCRPPGMLHGPYTACPHQGAKMFVILRHVKDKAGNPV